ncbi:MAG: outer membrane protein assembly factor BamA [Steroidobacteraceae bacterium]
MINKSPVWAILALLAAPLAHAQQEPLAESRFQVGDIRVEGLERVSEGTVLNYLPVDIGDELTPQRLREALRAVYETKFFRNVELRRDGDTLIVDVRERPSIDSFEIQGNKDLKTEDLTKSLRGVGLAAGKTFDRSVLEEVKSYLTDQYFSRGKYGVKIDTTVDELAGNRVSIKIDIKEGDRARIRQISIVGNTKYSEKDILETFESKTPKWNSWYKSNDRYGREAMQGDLEKLKSWYQDRGYANFEIESAQVTISDDKQDMFITVSVKEGEIYRISEAKIAGNTIVPLLELQALVQVRKGQIYSQQRISATQKFIENRLGAEGYAFAKVDPVPKLDDEKKEVVITFLVDPGKRVYVRHIKFTGVDRTNDVVLRREMRQLEGAWVSNLALESSKRRLEQLPYIEKVDFEKSKVEGTDDLVDVDFTIKERPSASLSGALGYSASSAFILQGSYADSNFMGTGKRVAFDVDTSKYSRSLTFSHTNPYIGINNISRSVNVRYSDVSQFVSASSDFSSKTFSFGLDFGYPIINDYQVIRFGANATRSELLTTSNGSAQQAQNWVKQNGNPFSHSAVDVLGNVYEFFGSKFTALELSASWSVQGLNRGLFPDRGQKQVLSLSSSIPGTDVEYWVLDYEFQQYLPVWRRFTGLLNLRASYGNSFGSTKGLPPYRLFFGGGPDTVRGFKESRMGPKDDFGNPYGGNLLIVGRTEIIIPMPAKFETSARVSVFHDIGNVFSTGKDTQFFGLDGLTPVTYKFKFANLRRSAGLSVEWLAPLGLFRFSYAIPLRSSKGSSVLYRDEKERFQFSVGQAF